MNLLRVAPCNVSQLRWLQHWRHVSRINRRTRVSIFVSSPKGAYSSVSLSFCLPLYYLLSRQFPSFSFIRLLLPSSFMSSPLLPRVCTQSQTSVAGKAKRRAEDRFFFFFLKRPDDALMRPGLCGWTDSGFYSEIVADKGRVNRTLRTPLGTSRRSLVNCRDLAVF